MAPYPSFTVEKVPLALFTVRRLCSQRNPGHWLCPYHGWELPLRTNYIAPAVDAYYHRDMLISQSRNGI